MENMNHTAPALDEETRKRLVEQTDRAALKEAAQKELPVKQVREIQHRKLDRLFKEPGDGAQHIQGTVLQDIHADIDALNQKREQQTAPVSDAKVGDLGGNTIGLQKDGSKEIFLDASVLTQKGLETQSGLANKTAKHELAHRQQEDGDGAFELPPTGNPVVDGERKVLRRLIFRERDSMEAEGGPHEYTSRQYIEQYWNVVGAVQEELNKRGRDGKKLTEEAGKTMEGFRNLQREMTIAVLLDPQGTGKPQLEDAEQQMAMAA